ncbi:helix-turn-helix domain-containing protein [Erwiniaceae bacterium L1_54_6]|nr:helix-turn-helix domain-containing protein [Erwiniaceae bacterium L1_54_6]
MSRAATDWAWSLDLKASQKILVLSLADRADEYHCCYPSIQRLVSDTGLDKKTIGKWIGQMIEMGLITDTGERKGSTKRVRVLRLNIEVKHTQKRVDSTADNNPEIGNIPENGNVPEIGCLNDPKIGCLNDPKIGSLNQSLEPNIETNKNIGTSAGAAMPSRNAKREYSPEFETAWQAYPKRAGGNPKPSAWKAWSARIREGAKPDDMIAGVIRYAAWVLATGKLGTEYVKQAARFFGPDRHFDEAWEVPRGTGFAGSGGRGNFGAISPPDKTIPDGFTGYLP